MPEALTDILWRRGDSYPFTIFVKTKSTETVPGVLIDITGYSFIFTATTIKEPPDDTTKVFSVVGVVAPDQVTNKGEVTFKPLVSDTELIVGAVGEEGKYYFDIEQTDAAGNIRTITPVGSRFTVNQDQTKPVT